MKNTDRSVLLSRRDALGLLGAGAGLGLVSAFAGEAEAAAAAWFQPASASARTMFKQSTDCETRTIACERNWPA